MYNIPECIGAMLNENGFVYDMNSGRSVLDSLWYKMYVK